jgi:hypothetical protein
MRIIDVNEVKSMSPINPQVDTIKTYTEDNQASDRTIGPSQLDKKSVCKSTKNVDPTI